MSPEHIEHQRVSLEPRAWFGRGVQQTRVTPCSCQNMKQNASPGRLPELELV